MNLDTLRLYCDVVRLRSSRAAAAGECPSRPRARRSSSSRRSWTRSSSIARAGRWSPPPRADARRGLLAGFEKARADLAASRQRVEGTVRVAAIYSVGLHDMSRHMQPFMAAYPNARVRLECLHPHKVVDAVLNDEADLGILSYPAASRALAVLPLREEPMLVVTHPSHPLARRRAVSPADLDGARFVAFDHDLPIRRAIDRALKQHGVKVDVAMEFDNVETIKQAIGIAAGISILPAPTVQKESEIKTLAAVELALPGLVRPVAIIHRRGRRHHRRRLALHRPAPGRRRPPRGGCADARCRVRRPARRRRVR